MEHLTHSWVRTAWPLKARLSSKCVMSAKWLKKKKKSRGNVLKKPHPSFFMNSLVNANWNDNVLKTTVVNPGITFQFFFSHGHMFYILGILSQVQSVQSSIITLYKKKYFILTYTCWLSSLSQHNLSSTISKNSSFDKVPWKKP